MTSSGSANKKVQEALLLFSELQQMPIADVDDGNRMRAVPTNAGATSQRGAASSSNKQSTVSNVHVDELRHKVSVADAIMKRLHKKNQELVAQLEAAQRSGGGAAATSSSGADAAAMLQLRRDIALRDRQIQELKSQMAAGGVRQGALVHQDQQEATSGSSRLLQQLHEAERKRLSSQYNALMECKLELISQGEATGKVNKEVKAFFQALKQKVLDDALYYEASRAAMNEALFDTEYKLASLGVSV